jgi:hypothetical protein
MQKEDKMFSLSLLFRGFLLIIIKIFLFLFLLLLSNFRIDKYISILFSGGKVNILSIKFIYKINYKKKYFNHKASILSPIT